MTMNKIKCSKRKLRQYSLLFVLALMGMSTGLSFGIIIPTLPNLKEKLNVTYESMGTMFSMSNLGALASLATAGYFYDTFPSYVPHMMFGECLLGAIVTIIIPWCYQFWLVTLLFCIIWAVNNAINNGGQMIILKTFKDKAVGKMQIYHLGYGIGSFLSGLICQPFLSKQVSHKTKITKYCKEKLESLGIIQLTNSSFVGNVTVSDTNYRGSFEYIYLIEGVVAICASLTFLLFISLKNPMKSQIRTETKESWLMKIRPSYIAKGNTAVAVSMIISLFLYYFFYIFGSVSFMSYIVVYAIDPCKEYSMSQKTAAYLHSAANGCFFLGRIIGSFIIDLNPTLILLLSNSFNVVFVSILLIFSNRYSIALWIGACGLRFCNSIVYPSGTSYVNRYIIVTSSLISIAFIGSTTGSFLGQSFFSHLLDNYPSNYVFYACLILLILFLIVTIVIVVIGKKVGLRNFNEEKRCSKSSSIELNKT